MLLFGPPLAVLGTLGDNADQTTFGGTSVGLLAAIALLAMILRRTVVMPAQACSPSGSTLLAKTDITRAACLQQRVGMSRRAGVHPDE